MRKDLFALCVAAALAAGCGGTTTDSPGTARGETPAGGNGQGAADPTTANGGAAHGGPMYAADLAGSGVPIRSGVATIDARNTKIGFLGTKDDGRHDGGFNEFSGTIEVDEDAREVRSIAVEIQTAKLWSDNQRLTGHLKNPDFFNVNEHPTVTFESTRIESDGGELTVTGNMTMLGNTRELSFPAKARVADGQLLLAAEFKIDRTRWGMTYERGVHHDVTIKIDVGTEAASAAGAQ